MFYTGVAVVFAAAVTFLNNTSISTTPMTRAEASAKGGDRYTGTVWPTTIGRWNTGTDADDD
jgi:hypothetical protein